jgi:hypothetical protein
LAVPVGNQAFPGSRSNTLSDASSVPEDLAPEAATALAAGLRFLQSAMRADGSLPSAKWRLAGGEEVDLVPERAVFPAALIGSVLLGVVGAEEIVAGTTRFVAAHREPEWVWRYLTQADPFADSLPPDVDDTALAALLLREAGDRVGTADAVLLSNRDRAGRFLTWITFRGEWWRSPARVRLLIRRLPHLRRVYRAFKEGMPRIRDMDAGVNANVVLYLGRHPGAERTVQYLVDLTRRGEIADRWYQDPLTLWYLISRALHRHGIAAGAVVLERLAECEPETPLQLAQATCIALDWGAPVPAEWIAGLAGSQSAGGGWERLPIYSVADQRWGGEATTTAFCVTALARWLRAGRSGGG